ncbi:hypothetical protein GCM10018987_14260 [Streptomyces cremeus]
MSIGAGIWVYVVTDRRDAVRTPPADGVPHRTSGVPYGVAVGLVYGVSSLAIKGLSALFDAGNLPGTVTAVLTSPYPYLLLVTGGTGLVLSQTALQRCRASLVVPVCTTTSCLYTATLGSLAFGESLPGEPLRLVLRVAGAALAVAVLLSLSSYEQPSPEKDLTREPH